MSTTAHIPVPFKQKLEALEFLVKTRDDARAHVESLSKLDSKPFAPSGGDALIRATYLLKQAKIWAWADAAIDTVQDFETLPMILVLLGGNQNLDADTKPMDIKTAMILMGHEEA